MDAEGGGPCKFNGPIRYRMMRHLRGTHKVGDPTEEMIGDNTTNTQSVTDGSTTTSVETKTEDESGDKSTKTETVNGH